MFIRAYLRASTDDQDAQRARYDLEQFAAQHNVAVASWYVENESGAKLARPELLRLIADAHRGDVLLIEQIDRLTRLTPADWETLKAALATKGIRIVSLDLPTSHGAMKPATDDTTQGILDAVNRMLVDILAVVSRKDYEDRRRRQAQGIAKKKAEGGYKGRPIDAMLHKNVSELLDNGTTWKRIVEITGASRSTILRVSKVREEAAQLAD
jgi:DNA invertase Pin-like site-specific DNA recombinase